MNIDYTLILNDTYAWMERAYIGHTSVIFVWNNVQILEMMMYNSKWKQRSYMRVVYL